MDELIRLESDRNDVIVRTDGTRWYFGDDLGDRYADFSLDHATGRKLCDAFSDHMDDLVLVISRDATHPQDLAQTIADFASAICSRRLTSGEDVTRFYDDLIQRLGTGA
jgi:hypothetical protein